jgi:hypothetical protein
MISENKKARFVTSLIKYQLIEKNKYIRTYCFKGSVIKRRKITSKSVLLQLQQLIYIYIFL